MRKLFGRKVQQPVQVQPQQHTKQPIDGPPSPSQQYPYPATQPRSQADHWQPIQERSDSFASSYQSSQPPLSQPATPSTAPTRSSFQLQSQQQQQQQQKHFVTSSRQSSQEDPSPLSGEQNWVVVDQPQSNLSGGGGIDAGPFVRAQPSFESRSSSIASLPAGASPPIQYPTSNPQPSPVSPFGVTPAAPPSQVNSPLGRQNTTTTKRLIPSRKHSTDSHTPRTTRQPVNPLRNISSSTEELSMMSQTPSQDTHKDKPKRTFLDWLAGDKEKIARAQHATERSLSPDPAGQNWGLTKLMGFMTATASEDWTLLMEVCEQASTEAGAKEAAKALRYEIKYAEAPAMLSAARLWAIMLRNTQPPFVQATSTKKFLDVVEDALNNPETSPVVRDRLLFVLAGASAQFGNKYPHLRSLWKKVKPREAPVEGIPFDPKDPMFQPPSRRLPKPGFVADPNQQQRPISAIEILPAAPHSQSRASLQSATNHPLPPIPNAQNPVVLQGVDVHLYPEEPQQRREREFSNGGGVVALDSPQVITQREKKPKNRNRLSKMIISPEEDIRRLFQECEIAKSNAALLTNAMTYAKPEEVVAGGADGLIREFYLKCMHSQEIITAQIPWATAQSERARATFLQAHPEAADNPEAHTVEEELLSDILMAHQELLEAFRVYDENEKLAMQEREIREVQERSKVEMRLDRTQIQYYSADGSFMTQPAAGAGGSGSRSASPVPPTIQGDLSQARSSPGPRAGHPLPTPPGASLGVPNAYESHHPNGSSHTLAPPPHAPHGPRHPRSRSPSPDGQSRRSVDSPRSTTATPGISGAVTPNGASTAGGRLDTLRRGMSKLGLDVKRTRSGSSASASGKGRKSAEVANGVAGQPHDDDDDEIRTPIQPSAKALGKRRADPAPEEAFDPDDIFKERTATPMGGYPPADDALLNSDSDSADDGANGHKSHVEYAYDAAAERKKELEKEAKKAARLRSSAPST